MGRAGRRAIEQYSAVALVDQKIDGARLGSALAGHRPIKALAEAAAQEGMDPDLGFEPQQGSAPQGWPAWLVPEVLATSARSASFMVPVGSSPRSCSNCRIASRVCSPICPSIRPGR